VSVSQRHPGEPTMSLQLPHRTQDFLQRFVDCALIQTSLDRRSVPPVIAPRRWVRTDLETALSPDNSREMRSKYRKARSYLIVERSS